MNPRRRYSVPLPDGRALALGERTLVMGILNVTPDSFSDGGAIQGFGASVDAALGMVDACADLIDVGGESTRPCASPVQEVEELRRVIPVIEALAEAVKKGVAVVRSSRTGSGLVDRNIEIEDDKLGFIASMELSPQKARILLMLGLMKTSDPATLQGYFNVY